MIFSRRSVLMMLANFYSIKNFFITQESTGLRILNYHSIAGRALGDDLGLFSISRELFVEQLNFLQARDYSFVPVDQLPCDKNNLNIGITFDDGYIDTFEIAAPILIERGIPFTVFLSTDFLKNKSNGFMTKGQVLDLSKYPNVKIGSHGKSHIRLAECSFNLLNQELIESKAFLEDLIGNQVELLAYPYGSVNEKVSKQALAAGYSKAFTTIFGLNKGNIDPMMIHRYNIESDNSVRIVNQKSRGDWDWYGLYQRIINNTLK